MRKSIPKAVRQQVYGKYDRHCAYCGKEIKYKDMQVDHLESYWKGGEDDISNYMPSCRRCNHYKRGNSLEGWRKMIEKIPEKLFLLTRLMRGATLHIVCNASHLSTFRTRRTFFRISSF